MQCAHKLRQPSKYWFYPNCTQVFSETFWERRGEERLKWNCHDPSIQCLIHFTSACRLLLSAIELPNRSLLDNWKTCHFVIWHTLCENHSHTFLMQRQIKEVLGCSRTAPRLFAFCVCTVGFFPMNICFLCVCLGVASPLMHAWKQYSVSSVVFQRISLFTTNSLRLHPHIRRQSMSCAVVNTARWQYQFDTLCQRP